MWTRLAGAVGALAVALAFAGVATAAPPTLTGAAYQQMKKFMTQYDKDGFARLTDLGSLATYRTTLGRLSLRVDPTAKAVAKYDPVSNSITFSKDPRTLKPSEVAAFGETVWHEVTHAIEDSHGDIGVFDNPDYAERNIDYMTHVTRAALPILEIMESKAKAGASVEKLRQYWDKYLKAMADAARLPSTKRYPPDLKLLRTWFGFKADPKTILKLYLSGKLLPGKQGANLRKALAALAPVPNQPPATSFPTLTSGTYALYVNGFNCTWKLAVTGSSLSGTMTCSAGGVPESLAGTVVQGKRFEVTRDCSVNFGGKPCTQVYTSTSYTNGTYGGMMEGTGGGGNFTLKRVG